MFDGRYRRNASRWFDSIGKILAMIDPNMTVLVTTGGVIEQPG